MTKYMKTNTWGNFFPALLSFFPVTAWGEDIIGELIMKNLESGEDFQSQHHEFLAHAIMSSLGPTM